MNCRFVLKKNRYATLFVFLMSLFLFQSVWPEVIPAGDGFGYDGTIYAEMVMRLDELISNAELSEYYSKRIVPSFIIRTIFQLFGLDASRANIIQAFIILNQALILLSMFFWVRISRALHLGTSAFWVGAAGLFLCFPNAKQIYYYPVLTDTFAFFVGCGFAYGLISRNALLIIILSVIGSFAWQITGIIGVILILTLLINQDVSECTQSRQPNGLGAPNLNYMLLYFTGFFIVISFLNSLEIWDASQLDHFIFGRHFEVSVSSRLITNLPMLGLVGLGFVRILLSLRPFRPRIAASPSRTALCVAGAAVVLLVPSALSGLIANPDLPPPGIDGLAEFIIAALAGRVSDGKVLLPVVAHAVYFGPVFLILILKWEPIVYSTIKLGVGYLIIFMIFLGFSVFSESRFNFLFWPFVVVIVAHAANKWRLSRIFLIVFGVLSLVYSRFWIRINQEPWPEPDYAFLDMWPKSIYFAHHGPWMNWPFYIGQGVLVLASLVILSWSFRGTSVNGNRL